MRSWDVKMRAGLGDHAEYHQPRQEREQIHSARLNIRQSNGSAMPVKQHHEYHLAVKIVRERKLRRRISEEKSLAGSTTSTPVNFVIVSLGWLVEEFVVGYIVALERLIPRLLRNKKWIVSGAPLLADIRWREEGVKIPTLQKPHLSSCAPLVFFVAGILFKSRL